jgi:hypothetical protein
MFVVSVVLCQVEVSETDWSLVQRSPTDCGASLCVWLRNLEHEEAKARYRAVKIQTQWVVTPGKKINKQLYLYNSADRLQYSVRAMYRIADKSLARPTSRCVLFDGENISFDASLFIYINSNNIPQIMIINKIYEHHNLLSLWLGSFLVGLRTYQHPCMKKWYENL